MIGERISNDILKYVPGWIYWKDVNGVYLGCNQAEAEVAGLNSPKDIIGKTDYDLPWKDNADTLRRTDQRIMRAKISEEMVESVAFANGKKLIMLTKKSPLYDDENNVIGIIGISIDTTYRTKIEELQNRSQMLSYANNILQHAPGCVYWKDANGVYLGCNQMEAEMAGLNSPKDMIGKTDHDLSWKYVADILKKTDQRIMQTKVPEELIESSTLASGENLVMLTKKSPLYDDKNNVIGVIGVSIDITDRKKAEELQNKLEIQQKLHTIAARVYHDICSPISSLKLVASLCKNKISATEQKILELSITSIWNIVNSLLSEYKDIKNAKLSSGRNKIIVNRSKTEEYVSPHLDLMNTVEGKRFQYQKSNIIFNYRSDSNQKLVFIKGSSCDFYRMMSNVINNAVEAVEKKQGIIDIELGIKDGNVTIKVKDNGKGMPKEIADKIMNSVDFGTTKKAGYGIGLQQVRDTLKTMNAQMLIKSEENVGTEFTFIFPIEMPKWFADKIELRKGDTIVVLDDDVLVHDMWKSRFSEHSNEVSVKYFTQGLETIDFITSLKEKNKVFLLSDYELENQELNGIDVIEKSNMQEQHILVTGVQIPEIKDFNEKSKFLKMFNKAYFNDIPLIIL